MRAAAARLGRVVAGRALRPQVSFAHRFHRPPYGGSNQFLLALAGELRRRGVRVGANIAYPGTRGIVVNSFLFDEPQLAAMVRRGARVVHRVDGPVSTYRGTDDGTDARIVDVNRRFADVTVFQSRYSLEKHRELGIELHDPRVITNAVDPTIFYGGAREPVRARRVRLIATSWSDNPNKGAALYAWLDEHLDRDRYELTFVGRLPVALAHARSIPPVDSQGVAALLREHDVYITASRHEPCSNALLEALACGLPAVYLDSGSHGELVGEAGAAFHGEDDVLAAIDTVTDRLDEFRSSIRVTSIDEVAQGYLDALGIEAQ